jgi:hypothetical protein
MDDVVILPSARRHGIDDDAIRHAVTHAFDRFPQDGFEMVVGADHSGRLIEVAVRDEAGHLVAFHAMPARPKFLR